MYYQSFYDSPLGKMILLADESALLGIYFAGQTYELKGYEEAERGLIETPILAAAREGLEVYFSGENVDWSGIPFEARGTDFQKRVWRALIAIPYGETRTYGQLAKEIGCNSAQAVGNAVGKNPLTILIPCHRVLGKDGSLTGYAGGLERKQYLLEWEKKHVDLL